jgi:hypothetical protein
MRIYLFWWCCCSSVQSRWSSLHRISWKRPFSFSVLWAALKRKRHYCMHTWMYEPKVFFSLLFY